MSVALASLALVIAVTALARVFFMSRAETTAPGPAYDDTSVWKSVDDLRLDVDLVRAEYAEHTGWRTGIEMAVDEGIRDVKRTRNRIQATVRRAKEQLEEEGIVSPGVEAEAAELRDLDGPGSNAEGMRLVPPNVDPARAAALAALPGDFG